MDFDIVMLVPGMPFDGETLEKESLGGSETAGLYMAKALANRGHHVTVFCNTAHSTEDALGVRYVPIAGYEQYSQVTPHDINIVQRAPEMFRNRYASRLNILWTHDLLHGRHIDQFRSALWNIDNVLVLSDFMLNQYVELLGEDARGVLWQTRNGVDLKLIQRLREEYNGVARNTKRLMYAARPERGLDVLVKDIMPRLLKADPEIEVCVAGYNNPVEHFANFYAAIDRAGKLYGKNFRWLGNLTKEQLYREYLQAGAYVYPTPSQIMPEFAEVSCISLMEAQACGLPVVTSARGALPETLAPDAGILIKEEPWTEAYYDKFAEAVLEVVNYDGAAAGMAAAGMVNADANLGWDGVAADWEHRFTYLLKDRSFNLNTLLNHFWRQSDIMAAKALAANYPEIKDTAAELLKDFAFMDEEDGYRKQYERIGETHDVRALDWSPQESRYQVLKEWLEAHPEASNIIDYGCAHGGYCVNLHKELGRQWLGVDIDKHSVAMAQEAAGGADGIHFQIATHDTVIGEGYNCLIAQEVLEHVPYPWEVIDELEKHVSDDGWVYVTVPFGPWEYTSYATYPWRCHIWHFDMHDLRDMFGAKKDFNVQALSGSASPLMGDSLGWWIVTYRKSDIKTGVIDMDRKHWLQAPRQTVSVNIMAGPNCEETLHWNLRSVQGLADELLIADCGMSSEAQHIASMYGAKLLPAPDPKQVGFEVPRNVLLDASKSDWVLWIDTDEKLIGTNSIHKYLRENMFHGYGIRQHHFACDTTFSPDIPVRLFRTRQHGENAMRFYGAIHEHPELALNAGPGPVIVLADAHIAHIGYLSEDVRQGRFVRNYPLLQLDQQRYPDRILQKHFIMRDNVQLCQFELLQNGGLVTEAMKQKCHEAVELYRKHFLGKNVYMAADSLQYYSRALEILGEGISVAYQVDACREREASVNGSRVARFASYDDFNAEFAAQAKRKFQPLEARYY